MAYAALGASLSPEVLEGALRLLPSCYSARFDTCWDCELDDDACIDSSPYPNCRYLNDAVKADSTHAFRKAVNAMPFCPAPRSPILLGGVAVGVLGVGMLLGAAVASR